MSDFSEPPPPRPGELTVLLERAQDPDDAESAEEFIRVVYAELRRTAKALMRRERQGHSLVATDVVHEAYFRLFNDDASWTDRRHFFGSAAIAMRRVLIDHARRKKAGRRIPQEEIVEIEPGNEPFELPDLDILTLDGALTRLAEVHPRQAEIVELRFFAGLTESEIAQLLDVSRMTVTRDWKVARLWLQREMRRSSESSSD